MRTFAWLSHERPDLLRRSVSSLTNALGEQAKSLRYIIAESGISQIAPDYLPSEDVLYIDDVYREKLILEIEKGLEFYGLPIETARFALGAHHIEGSEGIHRNAINLSTIGETFISSDDDVVFDIRSLPRSIHKQKTANSKTFFSFKDWSDLEVFELETYSVTVSDFIWLHERVLQRAAFSSPGLRGHSIYGGPRFIFTFDDESLGNFCENPQFIDEALGSRILWNEAVESHMVPYSSIATYMLGMNNQFMLAPCFPFGRNVDGAFVCATKALNAEAMTAHLHASVLHKPIMDRGAYSDLGKLDFRINDYIWLMWSEWLQDVPLSLATDDRYALAADHFKKMAEQTPIKFAESLKNLSRRSLMARVTNLESQLERLKSHTFVTKSSWPKLARQEVELCKKMVIENDLYLPIESFRDGRNRDEQLQVTQGWFQSYAYLIEAWPFMRAMMSNIKLS
ncbi:hypothetical protein SHI21_06325 [Bacteriovorax sp. PP10]|uniref:Uncharacterized protein n=1 Tax=Bacteriovorax antarcticus TaxID=3088717 RepID=A0ABU5VRX9_9BACT|nr:hypothetical protein [Bacteriovorax sp. PP10]MEA9355806.1 hypothetical protein [Bacteriovorax sp. PP10]